MPAGPWFQHTKNAARKNAAKSKHKKHCKKIFIFLIILHIKYEDKKNLTTTEYKKSRKKQEEKSYDEHRLSK